MKYESPGSRDRRRDGETHVGRIQMGSLAAARYAGFTAATNYIPVGMSGVRVWVKVLIYWLRKLRMARIDECCQTRAKTNA